MKVRAAGARRRGAASPPAMRTELMIAAPQVVAHRVARMALAGPGPSGRDGAGLSVLSRGLAPVHRTALANALPLAATRLR